MYPLRLFIARSISGGVVNFPSAISFTSDRNSPTYETSASARTLELTRLAEEYRVPELADADEDERLLRRLRRLFVVDDDDLRLRLRFDDDGIYTSV
jgi:hypothetical protein